MSVRNLLLRNSQSPGDVLMLTAAVRDLHAQHPGKFRTAVATSAGAIWEGNPNIVSSEQFSVGSGGRLLQMKAFRLYGLLAGDLFAVVSVLCAPELRKSAAHNGEQPLFESPAGAVVAEARYRIGDFDESVPHDIMAVLLRKSGAHGDGEQHGPIVGEEILPSCVVAHVTECAENRHAFSESSARMGKDEPALFMSLRF